MKKIKILNDFITHFKNEDICIKYLKKIRFANGNYFPHCGEKNIYEYSDKKHYKCPKCLKKFIIKEAEHNNCNIEI